MGRYGLFAPRRGGAGELRGAGDGGANAGALGADEAYIEGGGEPPSPGRGAAATGGGGKFIARCASGEEGAKGRGGERGSKGRVAREGSAGSHVSPRNEVLKQNKLDCRRES